MNFDPASSFKGKSDPFKGWNSSQRKKRLWKPDGRLHGGVLQAAVEVVAPSAWGLPLLRDLLAAACQAAGGTS